jgi:membrane protein
MRRAVAALRPTLRYWMQTEVHVYAFSVAANVLLSFYPFLIVMMSVSRFFFKEQTTVSAIQLALRDYFPDSFTSFLYTKGQHENLPPRRATEIASIILLLFTANGIFEPLEVALNHVWGIRKNRSYFRNQLVSLGLIFACGTLALGSMSLTALNTSPERGWFGITAAFLPALFFKLAAIPMAVMILFLIYYFLPNGRPPVKRVLAAAIGVGLLLEGFKYFNKLVWPWFQRKLENEYRIFQYSVSLIFLGFLASMIVLAGAEWAARGHRIQTNDKEQNNA